jgi:uncharacterized protein
MTKNAKRAKFRIAGENIAPGTSEKVEILVSELSVGMQAKLEACVFHGHKEGPVIFVSAAIHGDEIIGTEIIRRLMKRLRPGRISGTIIFIPVVNMYGFITQSRYLPDRRDLNRSFPGSPRGSLASQLAHIFYSEIVTKCSLGIDIHSAAINRYNLPQIRIASGNAHLKDLALAFAPPIIIEAPLRDGSLREIAKGDGTEMLLLEAGEALRFDEGAITIAIDGILRVLKHLKMIGTVRLSKPPPHPAQATSTRWLRASQGGVCRLEKKSGDTVHKGDVVAVICDIFGNDEEAIYSPCDGKIIGHATLPIVNQGDAIIHIAEIIITNACEPGTANADDTGLNIRMLDEDEVI